MIPWKGRENTMGIILASLAGILIIGPMGQLFVKGILYGVRNHEVFIELFSERIISLLVRSIALSVMVGVSTLLLSFWCGLAIWNYRKISVIQAFYSLLLMSLIPPYIHAQSWIFFMDRISDWLISLGFIGFNFNGFAASWLVLVMSYLPFGLCFVLVALFSINQELMDTARINTGNYGLISKIIFPQCSQLLVTGFIVIFVLSLVDYTIPSLFGVRVYPLHIYARFSVDSSQGLAFIDSIPLLVIASMGLILIFMGIRSSEIDISSWGQVRRSDGRELPDSLWSKSIMILCLVILVFQLFVPVINLIMEVDTIGPVLLSLGEISRTLLTSILAAIMGVVLGFGLSGLLNRYHTLAWLVWPVLMFVFIMPSPLVGIALLSFWEGSFIGLENSIVMIAMAGVVRFLPIITLLLYLQEKALNRDIMDAGKLFAESYRSYLLKIKLPMMTGGLVGGAGIMFALTAGELGATLMIAPPGKGTLTMKIYNYLHYGASGTVAALCLSLLGIIMIPGCLITWNSIRKNWIRKSKSIKSYEE